MVVTRRTPVVPPPPPLARNPSLRGAQRPSRTSSAKDAVGASKNTASGIAPTSLDNSSTSSKDHHNGLDNNPAKKAKKPKRRIKNKYQKSNFQAFLDFLTKLLLFAFTIYSFTVCSQDTHSQSPICRGLTEYKRIVLDPYIIPPIQAMFSHPSVSPHIEHVKPYLHRAVEITAPILHRTQQQWDLHVVPQWEKRIVPEWNKHIVPLWYKYVIPQWNGHIAPRIQLVQSKVEPYRLFVSREYTQRFVPRAQLAFYNLRRWQHQAQPYVLLAASRIKNGYHAAKPYAIPLARKTGYLLQQFALFLRQQRQKFVDPHVAKIWEKVKELSSGQVIRESTFRHASVETTSVLSTHSVFDVIHTPKETDVADSSPSISADVTTQFKPHSTSADATLAPTPEPETLAPLSGSATGVEFFPDAELVVVESQDETVVLPPDVPAFTEEYDTPSALTIATTASPPIPLPTVDEPGESPTPTTQSKIAVPAASATVPPSGPSTEDDIDLDAFYAELGLDEPLGDPSESQEYVPAPPSPPTETEDEKAERLRLKAEETARKRAVIEARQINWEAQLEAQMERSTSQLQNRLGNLRTAAAAELASSAEVRRSIEELVSEAEKYIKGAEIYLRNLKGENRRSDEKLALWDRVADRVNDKFIERLSATEQVVHAWHGVILNKELQEVATVTAEVREVAEKGQLDLGLDYAWLEDVTYDDWQRYHALIGTSERYAHEAASIQSGSHPKVVVTNPMDSIIADLESEVQDVVIGFETRLRRIKRDGERAFTNHNNGVAQKEEEKGSIVEPDPEVSILPVPHEQGSIPPVVIGRSQEEVLEALSKVEPAGRIEQKTERGTGIGHMEL